jgi:hypothetical protein
VLVAAFIAVASVVKPTVVPTVVATALMHQNNEIATAATVRASTPPPPGSATTLFLSSSIEASCGLFLMTPMNRFYTAITHLALRPGRFLGLYDQPS